MNFARWNGKREKKKFREWGGQGQLVGLILLTINLKIEYLDCHNTHLVPFTSGYILWLSKYRYFATPILMDLMESEAYPSLRKGLSTLVNRLK